MASSPRGDTLPWEEWKGSVTEEMIPEAIRTEHAKQKVLEVKVKKGKEELWAQGKVTGLEGGAGRCTATVQGSSNLVLSLS